MNLERLKRETASDHKQVEKCIPLMSEALDRAEYVLCLQRIHGVVAAWEEKAAGDWPDWVQGLMTGRQRRELLESDLADFGVLEYGSERPVLPEMNNEASLLGAMYVMEGSTLGGQLIARQVERVLGLKEGHGNAYFRGYKEQTGTMWRDFCEALRMRIPDNNAEAVIGTAKAMFKVFGSWMQHTSRETLFLPKPRYALLVDELKPQ